MRFGLVAKNGHHDHSLLPANLILCTTTGGYEVIVCLAAGKMVVRKPTNPEPI
jgi:hypothetical protein